jgi:hypothetical protein
MFNFCSCGKKIHKTSIRCRSCEIKRRHELGIIDAHKSNYKGGLEVRTRYCEDCGIKLNKTAYYRGDKRCHSCSHKGNLNYFYGKKLTIEHKEKISKNHANVKGNNNPFFGKINHGIGEYYKGFFMRSSYELKFAKFLDNQKIKWLYEPKAFDLINTTYRPDFYLPETDEYIEIKGYWRDDAKIKFNLFKIFYPKENIKVLMKEDLKNLEVL